MINALFGEIKKQVAKMFMCASNLKSIKSSCIFRGFQGYQSSDFSVLVCKVA
jgi:hypothetical protein